MNKLLLIVSLLYTSGSFSQVWQGKIIDKETNAPLGYVNITYQKNATYSFSDSNGVFYINKAIIGHSDTINFSLVGYRKISFPVEKVFETGIVRLEPQAKQLEAIEIKACPEPEIIKVVDYPSTNRSFGGAPGATSFVMKAVYDNNSGREGYLHQLSFYVAPYSRNLHIPLRIHWYLWDEASQAISTELTDTSVIVFPKRKRWNTITLPDRLINAGKKIALGLEFIYPAELQKVYWETPKEAKDKWVQENIWWINVVKPPKEERPYFVKPSLRLMIKACK